MSRNRRTRKATQAVAEMVAIMRRQNHEAIVAAMREGRVQKAQTFADRKRVASKRACRGRVIVED